MRNFVSHDSRTLCVRWLALPMVGIKDADGRHQRFRGLRNLRLVVMGEVY